MERGPLKVLVVDDTAVYRKIVADALATLPGVEVVGVAANGKIALAKVEQLRPDLLTLDIEMPVMGGLEVLERLPGVSAEAGALVLSTLTQAGGAMTVRALELGAFDFLPKPHAGTLEENLAALREALAPRIEAFRRQAEVRARLRAHGRTVPAPAPAPERAPAPRAEAPWPGADVVGIGVSTGGPNALSAVLSRLPQGLGVPVLVVQHMPALFTASLAQNLAKKCALPVREAQDGERLEPGTVLIAPGGRQMKVVAGVDGLSRVVRITDDPPENACRPSADYLFRSLSELFAGRAVAVILTGMGNDGVRGLGLLKRTGCRVIAQDEATSVVWGMPGAAVGAGVVDLVSPLGRIPEDLLRAIRPGTGAWHAIHGR